MLSSPRQRDLDFANDACRGELKPRLSAQIGPDSPFHQQRAEGPATQSLIHTLALGALVTDGS
jgi:hypothetical protein